DRLRALTEPADLAHTAAQLLGETLGVSRCGYGTIDLLAETILIERDWHRPDIASTSGLAKFRHFGSYFDDLMRGELVVIEDVRLDPRTVSTAHALEANRVRSFVNVPIMEQGAMVAVLYLGDAQVRAWSAEELAFIREVAERTR